MKLYFMKQNAIDYIKANINTLYINYYRYNNNEWILDLFDYDPFEFFMEVPDFELSKIEGTTGEIELDNCKILYSNLERISASQASDERLWAGLCNGVFYSYLRKRWKYATLKMNDVEKDAAAILSRFFFSGGKRAGLYRNSLSKCWWVGFLTYNKYENDRWKLLNYIGANDFSTKVSDIFYSYNFSANIEILKGICYGIRFFESKGIKIATREHIRPALQYLNAIGGGVLLDMYSSEEIEKLFVEKIFRIREGVQDDFVEENSELVEEEIENNLEDILEEVNVDYNTYKELLTSDIGENTKDNLGKINEVMYGSRVFVHMMPSDNDMEYNIPLKDGERELYSVEKLLLGKKVGDVVVRGAKQFEVLSIH